MAKKHLHIICFDVPFPVDYGGVFDPFNTIRMLSAAGINIQLHCFAYGRAEQPELNKYCTSVYYYPRKSFWSTMSSGLPYIVASRSNDLLAERIQADKSPVLMQGVHSTFYLNSGLLPRERAFVRLLNVEHQYYANLSQAENSIWKKIYFKRESNLLKKYENTIAKKANFSTVADSDLQFFQEKMGFSNIQFLPVLLPDTAIFFDDERGGYCLYHGNLSVAENEYAATWLIQHIFSGLQIPLVIAGKNPGVQLQALAKQQPNVCMVANPDDSAMQELIRKAQVNILPSFNNTGVKLKLLNVLKQGKHCIVNTAGVNGSGLESCCRITDTTEKMRKEVQCLFNRCFTQQEHQDRLNIFSEKFNNQANTAKFIEWIWGKKE